MIDITVGTFVTLLSRVENEALDNFWIDTSKKKYPIIDLQGNLGYSLLSEDELLLIRNDFGSSYDLYELVFGSLFLPDTVQELLSQDKVVLLLVYEKEKHNLLLSELDADTKYMLDLPRGEYFFFAFVADAKAESLLDSTIYAVGFPAKENLNSPEHEGFYLKHPTDILEFVDPGPLAIKQGGPYYLNLIMVDAEKIPDCSIFISGLLQEDESTPSL